MTRRLLPALLLLAACTTRAPEGKRPVVGPDTVLGPIELPELRDLPPPSARGALPSGSVTVDTVADTAQTGTGYTIVRRATVVVTVSVRVTATDTIARSPGPMATGIPFGPYNVVPPAGGSLLTVYAASPASLESQLRAAQAAGKHVVVAFAGGGHDQYIDPGTHQWSLTRWRQRAIDRWRPDSAVWARYIANGTLLAHSLIDEPQCVGCWNGHAIPWASVEAAACLSKRFFVKLPALSRSDVATLASAYAWRCLDGGLAQYSAASGDAAAFAQRQATASRGANLTLVIGVNAENGGKVVSGCRNTGSSPGHCNMTGAELLTYGTALTAPPEVGGFTWWGQDAAWQAAYAGRSDVSSALRTLTPRFAAHPRPRWLRR